MKKIPIRSLKQEAPAISEAFFIRTLQSILGGKDLDQERHRHDYFFLLVLEKAKGTHEIDFTSYKVANHSVFFLRPGQVHQLKLKTGSTGFVIQFSSNFFSIQDPTSNQLLRKASNKNHCSWEVKRFDKIVSVLNYIFNEYKNRQEGFEEVIRSNMKIFFIELIRQQQKGDRKLGPEKKYQQERLEEYLELVEVHHSIHKQVQHYADQLHLSPYQLNAITKATLGKTSSEIINEYVILESKRNLLATGNQVSEVAHALGFDDVSYFIRFFKKHTGYSPESFRNNFR